jgi:hypothetical protein
MKSTTIELEKSKDCKGSVRFDNADTKAVVSSIYINRIFPAINDAKKVRVTIEVLEGDGIL